MKDKTDYLLKHEQLHFDIAELFARKMRKQFSEKKFNLKSMKTEMSNLYKDQFTKLGEYQKEYDKETNHSRITKKQAKWAKDVQEALDNLDGFKDTTVVLTVK